MAYGIRRVTEIDMNVEYSNDLKSPDAKVLKSYSGENLERTTED